MATSVPTGNGTRQRLSSKVAETARQERAQGGQPQAHDSGDAEINKSDANKGGAAGPHNKPGEINKHSTPGTGMLGEPGKASDDDMAPSG
jgi:hypothetical protein